MSEETIKIESGPISKLEITPSSGAIRIQVYSGIDRPHTNGTGRGLVQERIGEIYVHPDGTVHLDKGILQAFKRCQDNELAVVIGPEGQHICPKCNIQLLDAPNDPDKKVCPVCGYAYID